MAAQDVVMVASKPDDHIPLMLGPAGAMRNQVEPPEPLTKRQRRLMVKRFQAESRRRRRLFTQESQRDWEAHIAPVFDQEENGNPAADTLLDEEVAYHDFMPRRLERFDDDLASKKDDFLDGLRRESIVRPHSRWRITGLQSESYSG